jgi:outer membrane autotransporter protein
MVTARVSKPASPSTCRRAPRWRHAFGDVVPSVLLAFQGGAQGFSTAGVPIDRDAFVAEVGIDYAVSSSVRVGLSASSQIGSRASDYAFKGHIEVSF